MSTKVSLFNFLPYILFNSFTNEIIGSDGSVGVFDSVGEPSIDGPIINPPD